MDNSLTSEWGNLSPHLVATFFEVDRQGKRVDENLTVKGPLSAIDLDVTQNWNSPFEGAAQGFKPVSQNMLQSGEAANILKAGAEKIGLGESTIAESFTGRSSVTKLNATQVWAGSPPIKISLTIVFRAWSNSLREVEKPVDQLMQWALPKYLQADGIISGVIKKDTDSSVMPSIVPSILNFRFKGRVYSQMVIESIGVPLSSPIDGEGNFVELSLPITLAGLTSIDRNDWVKFKS